MSDATAGQRDSGVHWSFWVIGAIALLWNLGGVANYVMQTMNPDSLDAYREAERAIIDGRPAWATAAFAIAVFSGAVGCIMLLLRKSAAFYMFVASLPGIIVTVIHALGLVDRTIDAGTLMPQLMSLVVATFLIWYSKLAERKRWIR